MVEEAIEVLSTVNSKPIGTLKNVNPATTVKEIKKEIHSLKKSLKPQRLELRLEAKGKGLRDDSTIQASGVKGRVYVKDLGPQIGWKTVFLVEYAGPLVVYLWMYQRPWLFYGDGAGARPMHLTAHIAAGCWTFHYAKRLLETLFVHRFSHATMPLMNLFRNSAYYWLFTAYVAYHINHPLYTSPCQMQVYGGLAAFLFCEFGNLSIHLALRNLRPAGTSVRKIPVATGNPFTWLFNHVSCPNYTYEFGSWLSFTIMTQCLPAGIFALAGMYQMTVWALGKHRAYKKEFSNYPRSRKSIIPFIL
ncbi:hypothetical protein J437_LFUL007033 [Ladona fulva]|uniref:Ubiquitin-like domain-containing protein n=1 Tax=Ladona fulva TaxID=123851 RepID=A0A8K0K6U5_LADFU|nr:hypothetical protein J437_LFUL007033 [Ladona fulva]